MKLWRGGETLFLAGNLENIAHQEQEGHTEENPLNGMIEDYLNRKLPRDWYTRNIAARRAYIHNRGDFGAEEVKACALTRTRVCAMEIWCELLEGDPKNLQWSMSRNIMEAMRKMSGWKDEGRKLFSEPYGQQRAFELEQVG